MKKALLLIVMMAAAMLDVAADDLHSRLPSNRGGWMNLTYGVTDSTYYTSNMLPLETQISGNTIHVLFMDWAKNASGEYPIYYRRSTDLGKTWEAAQLITTNKDTWDGSYIAGQNSRLMAVSGNNVHLLIPYHEWASDFRLRYFRSTDGGKSFTQNTLKEGTKFPYFTYPHIVCDGNTVVAAVAEENNNSDYHVRVYTSTDGGNSFSDVLIEQVMYIQDLTVSGNSWIVLGTRNLIGGAYTRQGEVWIARSADGGKSVDVQNIAHVSGNGYTYSDVYTLNNPMYAYHPQMVQQGQIVDVMYRGSLSDGEPDPRYDYGHTIHQRSTDGGKTWSKPQYLPESTGMRGYAGTGTIAAKGDNIYIYTTWDEKYRIFHSHDGGKTWAVQQRGGWGGWSGDGDGYNMRDSYMLYIAPDDPTGQHAYLTGKRFYYAETRDGFRTLSRNFQKGRDASDQDQCTNEALRVLVDEKGTEHWFAQYVAPHKNYTSYFYNIVYRRNDPEPALGKTNMALDISETPGTMPKHQLTIPVTESLMATQKATTVECWAKIDEVGKTFQIASLTHTDGNSQGGRYSGGWYINIDSDYSKDHIVLVAGLTTDRSVDGVGKQIWERTYKIFQTGYWHHIALTYDDAVEKDNIRLYVDGVLIGTQTEHGNILMGSNPIVIGKADSYDTEAKVLIDNFTVWSRALPQSELLEHIYTAPDGKDKDCRLLLTFDGSMKDKSQYGNDAVPSISFTQLKEHDGIRPVHPEFTATKDMTGKTVYLNDITQDGECCWWVLPYPGNNSYTTDTKRHVSQDLSRYPGTYNFTMVAAPKGNCNAYASATQTVIIGGLSKVFPTEAAQDKGVRLRIQGGYELTYNKQPKVVLKQGNKEIEGKWLIEYGYTNKNVQSADQLPEALFDLSAAPVGKYDVIIGTDTLSQAFTLKAGGEEPDVWLQVNGRGASLWNKWQRYTIDYGNRSNVAAYNTPMFLIIPDRHGTVDVAFDFDFELCNIALDDYGQEIARRLGDHLMAYDEQTKDSIRIYSFMIPYIAPNSTNQVAFRIKMGQDQQSTSDDLTMYYWPELPWGAYDPDAPNPYERNATRAPYTMEQGECFAKAMGQAALETAIGFIPGVGCMYSAGKTIYQVADSKQRSWSSFLCNMVSTAFSCVAGPAGVLGDLAFQLASGVWNATSAGIGASDCLNGDPNAIGNKGRGSYDPNEMIGPWGHDDQAHFIKPIHQMGYTVTFENKASATAPAHEVFVTDTLDAKKYDLSTFTFTSYGWADTTLVVGGGKSQEFARDILYKVKGQDIIVRVSGQFDPQTGIARWSFVSLQKNGNEIDDPDLGFLVPNNDNRDGEGFVSFSIEHKKNPANKSTVSNKATIVFDANAPIETNTYVNTFDTDYPTSKITKVEENGKELTISLSGSDATSGIAHYNLYVFKNGGDAELVASGITGNSYKMPLDTKVKYAFCSIATDNVGWNEAKDVKPEIEFVSSGINDITLDATGRWTIFSAEGKKIYEGEGPVQQSLPSGVYIIRYGSSTRKVIVK